MAILREYRCKAHGEFEAFKPECPHGCSRRFVVLEFRTPVAVKSARTAHADKTLRGLADDYRMPDISNGSDGESVIQKLRKRPDFAPSWGEVKHAQPGFSSDKSISVPTFDPRSAGVTPESVLSQVQPMLHAPRPHVVGRHTE